MADHEEIIITSEEEYSKYCKTFVPQSFAYAAMFGFMFGYDIGLTGCLTSTPTSFLKNFFPDSYENLTFNNTDAFFDDHVLNFYRSCSYLLAFVSSFIVAAFSVPYQWQTYAINFLGLGILMDNYSTVPKIRMRLACRILFGFGLGVVFQDVDAYISKMTTPCRRYRGPVIVWFHLAVNLGILTPYLLYFVMSHLGIESGWYESLFNLAIPFFGFVFACIICHDENDPTTSIYLRSLSEQVRIPWSSIINGRKYWPSLVVAICISVFQQLTGVYAFMIYAPIFFKTIGLSEHDSLLCSSIIFGVNCLVAFVSIMSVEKFGRRKLLIHSGLLMLACQVIIAYNVGVQEGQDVIPKWNALMLVVAICGYTGAFAWSWGPLGWLLPSEILPLEIQSVGQRISVSMKMIFLFLVTQFFVVGFRKITFHMCLFLLSLMVVMTLFVYKFLPETKGVEVENVLEVWKTHPHWKRYFEEEHVDS